MWYHDRGVNYIWFAKIALTSIKEFKKKGEIPTDSIQSRTLVYSDLSIHNPIISNIYVFMSFCSRRKVSKNYPLTRVICWYWLSTIRATSIEYASYKHILILYYTLKTNSQGKSEKYNRFFNRLINLVWWCTNRYKVLNNL